MILFAAGDPGGSRALLPVIFELERRGRACGVMDHGFLGRELPEAHSPCRIPDDAAETALKLASCYVFGSSAADVRPLALARKAKSLGIPVVHVLDNWSGYAHRLRNDGLPPLEPDAYAVMDEAAKAGALADGIDETRLRVTGHPGLAELGKILETRRAASPDALRRELDLPEDKLVLAFVNEPLRRVLGTDVMAAGHYGFTEDRVLRLWAASLRPVADKSYVVILPHPKDDDEETAALWARVSNGLGGRVLRLPEGRAILPVADAAAGMASILLYESWLCGLPTLSMQPGVRAAAIRRFADLGGIFYADTEAKIDSASTAWMNGIRADRSAPPRKDLARHIEAPANVADLVEELLRP